MSYVALARKWRPQTFSELLGQEHLVTALENSLNTNRLHHAYLFTGTRGVGKTSVARILAKSLNCLEGISANPCLKCSSCLAFAEGRFIDLIEIDGASKTKVEDTRELLENVQYAPTIGRFKIYLIDEVHMLSQHSFNALLKTLEEPPQHVKFLLATTDPEKLPITILSRCIQFTLRNVPVDVIFTQLKKILLEECIEFSEEALYLLAEAANGSMRDSLSLLDQAIVGCKKAINLIDVKNILGYTQQDYAVDIINALITQRPHLLFNISQKINAEGGLFTYVIDKILHLLHKISLQQILANDITDPNIATLSVKITPEDTQLLYQIALKGRDDMLLAPTPLIGFEMLLLRMYTFTPFNNESLQKLPSASNCAQNLNTDSQSTLGSVDNSSSEALPPATCSRDPGVLINSQTDWVDSNLSGSREQVARPRNMKFQQTIVNENASDKSTTQFATEVEFTKNANQSNLEPQTSAPNQSSPPTTKESLTKIEWHTLIPKLQIRGLALTAAENASLVKFENNTYYLIADAAHESLFNKSVIETLENALSKVHQVKIKINLKIDKATTATPAKIRQQTATKNLQAASDSLDNDAFFQRLQNEFSAELIKNSIVSLKDSE